MHLELSVVLNYFKGERQSTCIVDKFKQSVGCNIVSRGFFQLSPSWSWSSSSPLFSSSGTIFVSHIALHNVIFSSFWFSYNLSVKRACLWKKQKQKGRTGKSAVGQNSYLTLSPTERYSPSPPPSGAAYSFIWHLLRCFSASAENTVVLWVI